MSSLSAKTTLQNLKQKGFTELNGDHKFLEFWYNNKLILHTKLSHGSSKDLYDGLILKMSRQCKLSKPQFMAFAKCTISHSQYIQILSEGDYL